MKKVVKFVENRMKIWQKFAVKQLKIGIKLLKIIENLFKNWKVIDQKLRKNDEKYLKIDQK